MASAISAGLQAGFLSPIVGHEYQLSQASDARRDIMEGKGAKGRSALCLHFSNLLLVVNSTYH